MESLFIFLRWVRFWSRLQFRNGHVQINPPKIEDNSTVYLWSNSSWINSYIPNYIFVAIGELTWLTSFGHLSKIIRIRNSKAFRQEKKLLTKSHGLIWNSLLLERKYLLNIERFSATPFQNGSLICRYLLRDHWSSFLNTLHLPPLRLSQKFPWSSQHPNPWRSRNHSAIDSGIPPY